MEKMCIRDSCPGCVLQIRGGAEKDGKGLKVTHISELLAENLKK